MSHISYMRPLIPIVKSGGFLNETILVCLQHLLPSILFLFKRILEFGFPSSNVFVIGKPYSTVESTIAELRSLGISVFISEDFLEPGLYQFGFDKQNSDFWKLIVSKATNATRMIVLDEGGSLRRTMPVEVSSKYQIVAIEHTSSGVDRSEQNSRQYPVILMARSFAKLKFETTFIVPSLVHRLVTELNQALFPISLSNKNHTLLELETITWINKPNFEVLKTKSIGLVGMGHLGRQLANYLIKNGVKNICVSDVDKSVFALPECRNLARVKLGDLVRQSDIILGCTGSKGALVDRALFGAEYKTALNHRLASPPGHSIERKFFASCSSGDREFSALIPHLKSVDSRYGSDVFRNARGQIGEFDVTLLNGGFPLNFDRLHEFEPRLKILLTRELTFASIVQASDMLQCANLETKESTNLNIALSPELQFRIVKAWASVLCIERYGEDRLWLNPAECEQIGIPYLPQDDPSLWATRSEGKTISDDFVSKYFGDRSDYNN